MSAPLELIKNWTAIQTLAPKQDNALQADSCYPANMQSRTNSLFLIVLAIIILSPGSIAQDEAAQDAKLEAALERLNEVITEEPSRLHHQRAEVLFRLGRFEESVQDYDAAAKFGWPHNEASCWERGLAQYYIGDFGGGREQFERYSRVGPLDIENGLWQFLCIAEENGVIEARQSMLEYPRRVRKPFPALLALYLDEGSAEAVLEEATRDVPASERTANLFNAHYYLGKFYEIVEQDDLALMHVQESLKHRIPHFMYACAEADAERLEEKRK